MACIKTNIRFVAVSLEMLVAFECHVPLFWWNTEDMQ